MLSEAWQILYLHVVLVDPYGNLVLSLAEGAASLSAHPAYSRYPLPVTDASRSVTGTRRVKGVGCEARGDLENFSARATHT